MTNIDPATIATMDGDGKAIADHIEASGADLGTAAATLLEASQLLVERVFPHDRRAARKMFARTLRRHANSIDRAAR